jgi:hypothetical protein
VARRRRRGPASGNRKIVLTVLVLGVLAAIVLGSGIRSSGSDSTDTGTPTRAQSAGPPPKIVSIKAYKVTYRTESLAAGDDIFTTETYFVRRPFESITYEYKGPPEKKIFVNERRQSFGLLGNEGLSHKPYSQVIAPGTPSGDMRLDSVLADLARRGAVITGKSKTINGHHCTVVKTMDPIFGAKPAPPNHKDHTDNCIDRHGIVIEERWWLSRQLTRIRTAQDIDLSPDFSDMPFTFAVKPIDPADGGSVMQKLDALPEHYTTVDAPAGFHQTGIYRFLLGRPPQNGARQFPLVRMLQVWQKGVDFIVLEQGQEDSGNGLPSRIGSIDLPMLTDGGISVSTSGTEVFGHDHNGQVWRLRGTITPERLVAVAKTIHN